MVTLAQSPPPARFVPRRDAWLVAVLLAVAAATIWLSVRAIGSVSGPVIKLVLTPVLLAVAGFSLWCLFGTSYRITASALLVRMGPFRWHVRLESIVEVAPDRNFLSSAALSLDRLRIRIAEGGNEIYVSPRDRERFLDCLQAACHGLQRDGKRLIRR